MEDDNVLMKYEELANKGDISSMLKLAKHFDYVQQDYQKAFFYYKKVAEQGNAEAQTKTGYFYEHGIGVQKNYTKAKEWYENGSENGDSDAQFLLGLLLYYHGSGTDIDNKKAKTLFEKLAKEGDIDAQYLLGFFNLFGLGTKENYDCAEELFRKCYNNGNKSIRYYIDIFDNLKNRKIRKIKSIADYIEKDIEEGLEAVFIKPNNNLVEQTHTFYDIETFKKIKEEIENIIEDIPKVKDDKSNEFEVFKQICIKIANLVSFDYSDTENNNEECSKKNFTSRNLIGAILEKKCVCAGYAELLRNICLCRNIECIYVGSLTHAFNQVNIGGCWYYFDLTDCCDIIKEKENVEDYLLSEKEFTSIRSDNKPLNSQFTYESPYCYGKKNVSRVFRQAVNVTGITSLNEAETYIDKEDHSNDIENNLAS